MGEVVQKRKTIATASLAGCFGCHMSLLDIDEKLFDVIELAEFNKSPITDIKEFSGMVDLGIVEGGCCNEENVKVLKSFREHCKILVSFGACAIWGGLPAMRNSFSLEECLQEAYIDSEMGVEGNRFIPHDPEIPKLLNRVYANHEVVKIDYFLPGCPPRAEAIFKLFTDVLSGREPDLPSEMLHYD